MTPFNFISIALIMLVQQWEELSVCIHRSLGMGIVLFFSSVDLFFFFKCMRYLHNQASAFSLCPCCFCSLLIRNYLEMDGISVKEKELMLLLHRCCIIYLPNSSLLIFWHVMIKMHALSIFQTPVFSFSDTYLKVNPVPSDLICLQRNPDSCSESKPLPIPSRYSCLSYSL